MKIDNGTARPCFAVDMLKAAEKKEFQIGDDEKLFVFSTLLEAGSDTSRNAITQFAAAAACYPEWVTKARIYLDEVCGSNAERLPSLADMDKLPYITAAFKETLRWRPFIQTGVPHMLTQDDEYEGYRFPAGTQFTWNAYAIALNEDDYKDPKRFMPERFLNSDLNNPLKGHWSFGTGTCEIRGCDISFEINKVQQLTRDERVQVAVYAWATMSLGTTYGWQSHV